ncbi:MAG: peptidylprolyl isomerase [Gammaproteobacteria bacterium]
MKNILKFIVLSTLFSISLINSSYADTAKTVTAVIETNMGNITLELYPEKAPKSVENFVKYANDGYFNGTVFHRVIEDFMIQGGGFKISEAGKFEKQETRESIKNEADNGLKNEVGTIAMARTHEPDSATAQFFINVKNNAFLNHTSPTPRGWGYAVFGKVSEGMDVVNKIRTVKTGAVAPFPKDVPMSPVTIIKIIIK